MLVLSDDQRMLMESARGAVAANAPIAAFRKLRAESFGEGFSRAFWRQCAEMGWTGVLVPEEFGGIDFGVVGAGLIAREMARTLAPSPFLSTAVIAASALRSGGSAAQKTAWLPRIAKGEAIVAAAIATGARGDSASVTATRARTGWRLDGARHMALDGHVADALLIAAEVEGGGASLFLAPAGAEGLKRDSRALVDGRRVASLRLDGVSLPADAALSGGAATLESTLDIARAVVAAALCGVAEEAFARTMAYLKERKQFERRIGSFQALQHRAARTHIDIENAWSATLKALESLAANANGAALDVAVAKAKASETACAATAECLQMHGGIGMTDEFDIGLFLKRARVESVFFGDAAFHADRVATMLGY
jgi:alkylation response protein AidB-like acyl-CoA dehydrogenase